MKSFKISFKLVVMISLLLLYSLSIQVYAQNSVQQKNIFAERPLIHILGPSPAITPSADSSAVDSEMLESCDVLKDNDGTYYWYYHAKSKDKKRWPGEYRLCVATSKSPLGPWKKYEGNPILDHGKEGEWDDKYTACASVMKVGAYNIRSNDATYYMWYWSNSSVGLATAKHPLGPWKKYEGNPVSNWEKEGGVYPGSVTKIGDKFYMFAESPVSVEDQGPMCIATASKPEGPWEKYEGNPVMKPGDWNSWDDGGFSEAGARYHEGVFHCVYGGTKAPKIESLGYAWSFDAIKWYKYEANPVVPLNRIPDASGLAEAHCFVEGAYIYVFHTLRYFTGKGTARGLASLGSSPGWQTEDLAVQVLTIDPKFRVAFPVLHDLSLNPGRSSRLAECLPIGLEAASGLSVAVECKYSAGAKAGLRLHVRGSEDGVQCDTEDLYTFDIPLLANHTVKKSFEIIPLVKFAKVIVENLDKSSKVDSVTVMATIVGN